MSKEKYITIAPVEPCKLQVKFKKLHVDAIVPLFAHEGDAGADLYSVEDKFIPIGEFAMVDSGIAIQLPFGWEAQVRCRSGLASKGLQIGNSPGTIDAGYRGEVRAIIHNFAYDRDNSPVPHRDKWASLIRGIQIKKGDRIAQLVFKPVWQVDFVEVEELGESERGSGGYGSTGK